MRLVSAALVVVLSLLPVGALSSSRYWSGHVPIIVGFTSDRVNWSSEDIYVRINFRWSDDPAVPPKSDYVLQASNTPWTGMSMMVPTHVEGVDDRDVSVAVAPPKDGDSPTVRQKVRTASTSGAYVYFRLCWKEGTSTGCYVWPYPVWVGSGTVGLCRFWF